MYMYTGRSGLHNVDIHVNNNRKKLQYSGLQYVHLFRHCRQHANETLTLRRLSTLFPTLSF